MSDIGLFATCTACRWSRWNQSNIHFFEQNFAKNQLNNKYREKKFRLYVTIAALGFTDLLLFFRIVQCRGGFFCWGLLHDFPFPTVHIPDTTALLYSWNATPSFHGATTPFQPANDRAKLHLFYVCGLGQFTHPWELRNEILPWRSTTPTYDYCGCRGSHYQL